MENWKLRTHSYRDSKRYVNNCTNVRLEKNYSLSCRHASVREVRLQMILATYFRQEAGGREKRSLMSISLPSVPSVYNLQGC